MSEDVKTGFDISLYAKRYTYQIDCKAIYNAARMASSSVLTRVSIS